MPGFFCTVMAWHGYMPQDLWSREVHDFVENHPMARGGWRGHASPIMLDASTGARIGLYGIFLIMSTATQCLRDYEVFFVPLPLPPMPIDWPSNLSADLSRLPLLLLRDWPAIYWGVFVNLGPLFGLDLRGDRIMSRSGPRPVYASIARVTIEHPTTAERVLRAAREAGAERPDSTEVPWWRAPLLALDRILPLNYYELYFMRDHGTGHGPCVALYATTRRISRSANSGSYYKVQLYHVPDLDPTRWWQYRHAHYLGPIMMDDWGGVPGDLLSRY